MRTPNEQSTVTYERWMELQVPGAKVPQQGQQASSDDDGLKPKFVGAFQTHGHTPRFCCLQLPSRWPGKEEVRGVGGGGG